VISPPTPLRAHYEPHDRLKAELRTDGPSRHFDDGAETSTQTASVVLRA
jgi:hypothetical protein